jgi:cyclopropane-fatty-acyl-phospholipid synthase
LPPGLGVRLWDGSYWPQQADYTTTLVLNNPYIWRKILLSGNEITMTDAYIYQDVDIEGDLEGIFPLALALRDLNRGPLGGFLNKARLLRAIMQMPTEKPLLPERASKKEWDGAADSGGKAENSIAAVQAAVAEETGSAEASLVRQGPAQTKLNRSRFAFLEGRRHSLKRDRAAIAYHYNLSNDFYSLWLDPTMTYSCAYFKEAGNSLAQAQQDKLEHICRKLRLKPGQRLLDIGCGWGGLAIYAATHYGVEVVGITLSHAQAELANKRVVEAGLQGKVRIIEEDYRELNEKGAFDGLVSVGMFEHVGAANLPTYFKKALDLLKPGGVFLNHGIGTGIVQKKAKGAKGPTFVNTYVFPDGEVELINETLRAAEGAGFEVRDVESLREHYRLTLQHWSRNLVANSGKALEYVGEPTFRVWKLYLAASAYGFGSNWLSLYQTLLVKTDQDGAAHLPLTRADWYKSETR